MTREARQCPYLEITIGSDQCGRDYHLADESPCHGRNGKILQLISAQGWRALYAVEQEGKPSVTESPLIGFGLVELCDGGQEVMPIAMMDRIGECLSRDSCANFLGILGPGEAADGYWQKEAEEYCEKARQKRRTA